MALRNFLIFIALLIVACTLSDQASSGQLDNTAVVQITRTLESFCFNWPSTKVQDVIVRLGAADRDVGFGLSILEYRLQDGSKVWIGSTNYSDILYVRHGTSLSESKLLYERR